MDRDVSEYLGKLARDKVTGFEGIITAVGIHLFGCTTFVLAPRSKDGKFDSSVTLDSGRVEIIGDGINAKEVEGDKPGCENVNLDERFI